MTQASAQNILLIDEDDVVRDSIKVLLESHGAQVEDFRNAGEFLSQARSIRSRCLILGFNRRISEGLELVATLRRRGMDLPAIFIVGGGDAVTKAAALAAGAFAYLERPIEEAALIRAIKAARSSRNEGAPPGGNSLGAGALQAPVRAGT